MARRAKKSKGTNFKVWVPIICVIVVGITFFMIHDMNKRIEEGNIPNNITSEQNAIENELEESENIIEENIVEENIVENEVSNEIVNEIKNEVNNKVSNTSKNNVTTNTTFAPAVPAVTDKKQEAIELVKKEWGADDTVSYVFEYIDEKGEYVIAVKDKSSATVKYYFRVNLETKTVELD